MAKYVVESTHTPEECLNALDEMLEKGPDTLDKFVWGCHSGVHKGWAYVDADNEDEACAIIPKSSQEKTKVTEVSKFTPEQIRSAHESK